MIPQDDGSKKPVTMTEHQDAIASVQRYKSLKEHASMTHPFSHHFLFCLP